MTGILPIRCKTKTINQSILSGRKEQIEEIISFHFLTNIATPKGDSTMILNALQLY